MNANLEQLASGLGQLAHINLIRCQAKEGFDHPLKSWSALEWAGAAAGESGEAANVAKKIKRLADGIRNKPADPQTAAELNRKLSKEIGDAVIYLDLLAQRQGLTLAECIAHAFNQTSTERGLPYFIV